MAGAKQQVRLMRRNRGVLGIKHDGFTLVELLIIVVVIGILVTISVIAYNTVMSNTRNSARQAAINAISLALEQYYSHNGEYPDCSAISGSVSQALSVLPELSAATLKAPLSSSDNSIVCSALTQGGSTDAYAYIVDSQNASYVLEYLNEPNSQIDSVSSRHTLAQLATVTTIAGDGRQGYVNGAATSAEFSNPSGVAVDASGNVYVGDQVNNAIRKITPSGVVSTLAGAANDSSGCANGQGSSASFSAPTTIIVDPNSGNIYVADDANAAIRQVTPSGVVSTIAGCNGSGLVNGPISSAKFGGGVDGLAVWGGNIYVADTYNNVIREIIGSSSVTTFAGTGSAGWVDGSATHAQFRIPREMAFDASGNLYVSDCNNNIIRKITPSGVVSTVAGDGSAGYKDGAALDAEFSCPEGLAFDSEGNLYIGDGSNYRIRKLTTTGIVVTVAGNGQATKQDGSGLQASFNYVDEIAIDSAGNIYLADHQGYIRKVSFSY